MTPEILRYYKSQWRFLTVLRHPIDRWFSNYFFNRYKKSGHFAIQASLIDYARSSPGRASARTYIRRFGGWKAGRDRDRCVARAKFALDGFDFVGTVEHMDQLQRRLGRYLGASLSITSRNTNPLSSNEQQRHLTPEVMETVRRECEADMAVYEHALALAQAGRQKGGTDDS